MPQTSQAAVDPWYAADQEPAPRKRERMTFRANLGAILTLPLIFVLAIIFALIVLITETSSVLAALLRRQNRN